jgi:hypothetical protein
VYRTRLIYKYSITCISTCGNIVVFLALHCSYGGSLSLSFIWSNSEFLPNIFANIFLKHSTNSPASGTHVVKRSKLFGSFWQFNAYTRITRFNLILEPRADTDYIQQSYLGLGMVIDQTSETLSLFSFSFFLFLLFFK